MNVVAGAVAAVAAECAEVLGRTWVHCSPPIAGSTSKASARQQPFVSIPAKSQ